MPETESAPALQHTNIAGRPHWITIATTLVSPSLALIALYISVQSLRQSSLSLEIGQSAYLYTQSGSFTLFDANAPGEKNTYAGTHYSIVVKNGRNTPARLTRLEWRYKLPKGWEWGESSGVSRTKLNQVIPPRESITLEFGTVEFTLDNDAFKQFAENKYYDSPEAHLTLVANNVFSHEQILAWCWTTNQSGYTYECK